GHVGDVAPGVLAPVGGRGLGSKYSPWPRSTSQWSKPCGSWPSPSPRCHLPTIPVRYPAACSWVAMVGSEASKEECRVVTPLRWLCIPVRIEARLGVHTELVQKQLSTRRPRSAIASMCGVCVTTDP